MMWIALLRKWTVRNKKKEGQAPRNKNKNKVKKKNQTPPIFDRRARSKHSRIAKRTKPTL